MRDMLMMFLPFVLIFVLAIFLIIRGVLIRSGHLTVKPVSETRRRVHALAVLALFVCSSILAKSLAVLPLGIAMASLTYSWLGARSQRPSS